MTKSAFNFDQDIDRREVPALKTHEMVLGKDGKHLFPAGVADMDFKPAPAILKAMQSRLEHGIFGYETVPDGLLPALTGWLKTRHEWTVNSDQILRAPNVLNILAMAVSKFTESGDGVIVQPPVFFDFFDIINENDRQVVSNPLVLKSGRYEIDFHGLEALAAEPNTKMLFLCNPHNPVGRVWSRGELKKIGKICAQNGVMVVSDEIHGDITFAGCAYTPFASIDEDFADNSITALSPAKSFNIAACCTAFTVIPNAEKRKEFQAENSRLTVNKNNAFASVAMEAAYTHGGPWLDQALIYIQGNLSLLRHHLSTTPGVTLIEPEGTFLPWVDFRELQLSSDELTNFLRQNAAWAPTRGPAFGKEGKGFARVNIACTRAKLEKAMEQLAGAVAQLPVATNQIEVTK